MPTILIIDDSPVNLKIVRKLLGDEYQSILADNGQKGLQLAAENLPDLILLDILMPDMDGLTVCRKLKSQPETAGIPVIFITVVSGSKEVVKGFEAGGQDYIIKPFSSQELLARIRTHLELKASREALKAYAKELEEKNRELNELVEELGVVAITDYLTNLPNRRYMLQRIAEEIGRMKRAKKAMVILLADIDEFKYVNDNFGHNCGDAVLKSLAAAMRACTREQDVVARWGGDEFMLLLPDTDLPGARAVVEKITATFEAEKFYEQNREFSVKVSFGAAAYDFAEELDANIKRADESLYAMKKLGH